MKPFRLVLAAMSMSASLPASASIPSVCFETGSATIPAYLRTVLRNLAEEAIREGPLRIRLTAWSDRVGSSVHNLRLSQRRGAAVRRELVRFGVSPDTILIDAKGETQLIVETVDGIADGNNRCVILDFLPPLERKGHRPG